MRGFDQVLLELVPSLRVFVVFHNRILPRRESRHTARLHSEPGRSDCKVLLVARGIDRQILIAGLRASERALARASALPYNRDVRCMWRWRAKVCQLPSAL